MNDLEFTFEESPWEQMLDTLHRGDRLSAVRFLTLMEGEEESQVEDALTDLEMGGVVLDVSELPKSVFTGEAALRLRREEQWADGDLKAAKLDENDPLKLYLEEIADIHTGDVQLLAEKSLSGSEQVRTELMNRMLPEVVNSARKMTGRGVLLMDLIQEGNLGLWQAIQTYEGGDFRNHSTWWIHQAMARTITMQARQNGVGQKMRQALEDYRAVDERLLGDLGRNPTLEEIAGELHMSVEETGVIRDMLDNARMMHKVKADAQPKEQTEDDERHVEDTAYFQMRQRITELLSMLTEEDARLLTLRFGLEGGLPLSPEETGKKLGLTLEEVLAKESAALAQLRKEK